MRAVCRTRSGGLELRDVPVPAATPDHVVIKISACGVNAGDKAWIAGLFPEIPVSQHDVCGACASGVITAVGEGVPSAWLGRKIAVYRSLQASSDCVGAWSEYVRIHYLNGVLLPDDVDERDYAASLVSAATACTFLDQTEDAGHRAVLCTAGTSATGRALLGICHARKIPVISLVRSEAGKAALWALDAKHVLAASDTSFDSELEKLAGTLGITAVFDGVGGALIGRVAKLLPPGSTIYCYGFMAGPEPLGFSSSLLLTRSLTLTSFSVLRPLAREPAALKRLLAGVQDVIAMPHFRTVLGKSFGFEQATEALAWHGQGKAVLTP